MKKYLLILFIAASLCKTTENFGQVNVSDSLALVDLYNSTNGAHWLHPWNLSEPISKWTGVSVSVDRVDVISLSSDSLKGTIPSSIGNLIGLYYLNMANNQLSGPLPEMSIGMTIQRINLESNQLTGNVPVSWAHLPNMDELLLGYNQLSGTFPSDFDSLTQNSQNSDYGLDVSSNNYTYAGMEIPIRLWPGSQFECMPQNPIPLHFNNNILSVSAGGTPSNNTYYLYNGNTLIAQQAVDSTFSITGPGTYSIRAYNVNFPEDDLGSTTIVVPGDSAIVPDQPRTVYADRSYEGADGWTNYYYDNGTPNDYTDDTLLLSLNLHGQNIGSFGDGTFGVKIVETADAGSNACVALTNPLMTGISNFWSMNRYWQVNAKTQPTSPVGVRFYYNNQDLADVNGSYPAHNLTDQQLVFYKTENGNPNPATNLSGATAVTALMNSSSASDNTWTYHQLIGTTQYAEFDVADLTGGGSAGFTYTINNTTIDTTIMPDEPRTEYANMQVTGADGWTNYYFNNNTPYDFTDDTLLLSLNLNGQNIGKIGDGKFALKLVATPGAGSGTAIELFNPMITNPSGFWVMNRYWNVTPTAEPTGDIGARFYYNNHDLTDVNGSYPYHDLLNQQLIFYKEIGGNPDPTTDLAGATKIISIMPNRYASDTTWTYTPISDLTQYAEFSVASFSGGGGGGTGNDQALPIKLLSFTATKNGNKNLLQWTTAQEVNSNYFSVERSNDDVSFNSLGNVSAKGNTAVATAYSFTDSKPNNGANHYRLRMVNKDGTYSYSEIRSINDAMHFAVNIYPNPVKDNLALNFSSDRTMDVQIEIINNEGKIMLSKQTSIAEGASAQNINVAALSGGTYYLRCVSGEGESEVRFVKVD
jgi:hypothetical protein